MPKNPSTPSISLRTSSLRTKRRHPTRKWLLALGVPTVLIPGLLIAMALGWNPSQLSSVKNYHAITSIFPTSGIVASVVDGDTFELTNGVGVRLIGIDAPNRGQDKWDQARVALTGLTLDQRVYLEYDRYQDDKYGRVLVWVWVKCEKEPTFLPSDYMHLSFNTSRPGLTDNPKGCETGKLVNEEMVKKGLANSEAYKDRGELKYEKRVLRLTQKN